MLGRRSLCTATAASFAVTFVSSCSLVLAWDVPGSSIVLSGRRTIAPRRPLIALRATEQSGACNEEAGCAQNNPSRRRDKYESHREGSLIINRRRDVLVGLWSAALAAAAVAVPTSASARCTDIETCREIGDRKVDEDMKANPTTTLPNGVRYKVLRPPTGRNADVQVKDGSTVDIVFSISANGAYMYSRGFGFEKIDVGGKKQSDLGLDSLRVKVGNERRDVPLGIEQALIGMKRGERRRIELPPSVGFETSEWRPEPLTRGGKASIASYKRILEGGPNQPAFPAVTYWDVELLRVKD